MPRNNGTHLARNDRNTVAEHKGVRGVVFAGARKVNKLLAAASSSLTK